MGHVRRSTAPPGEEGNEANAWKLLCQSRTVFPRTETGSTSRNRPFASGHCAASGFTTRPPDEAPTRSPW